MIERRETPDTLQSLRQDVNTLRDELDQMAATAAADRESLIRLIGRAEMELTAIKELYRMLRVEVEGIANDLAVLEGAH